MRGPARIAPAAPSTARPAPSTRRAWAASVTAAWSLLSVRTAVAQMTGTVDLGVSTVHYDGFLPSGAAAVTPVLRWDRPAGTLTASGTYLRFESGHRSLQGLLAGSFLTPPAAHAWRGEFAASAGASRYLDFASFWHVVAEARLHRLGAERGLWVGGTAGTTSYGTAPRPAIPRDPAVLHARGADGATVLRAARLEVHADRNRAVRLVVRVASAALVEIAGDFTDWQPVALGSASPDTWEVTLPVPSGV